MAAYQKRRNKDGTTSFLAWVRVKPYKAATRAFPDRTRAQQWAEGLEAELKKQRKSGEGRRDLPRMTLRALIEEFLADPEIQSLKYYGDLSRLLAWWINHHGSDKVLDFGTVELRAARTRLYNGRTAATVNRYLSALRSCWNWGRAAIPELTSRVWPTRLFLSEPRERIRFLSDTELAALLWAAQAHSPWMHAAVLVSLGSGLRQGELLRLTWADVDFGRSAVTVQLSKTDKRRTVHLPQPALEALERLRGCGVVKSLKYIFVDAHGEVIDKSYLIFRWKAVRKAAHLTDFRWHDLRHSCASFLAQNGASLVEIGSVLGHSSPSITAKYSHLVAGKPVTGALALAAKLRK